MKERRLIATPLKQWRPENLVAAGATEPDAD